MQLKPISYVDFKVLIQIVFAFSLQSAAGCGILIKIVSAMHFQAVVPGGSAGETG